MSHSSWLSAACYRRDISAKVTRISELMSDFAVKVTEQLEMTENSRVIGSSRNMYAQLCQARAVHCFPLSKRRRSSRKRSINLGGESRTG